MFSILQVLDTLKRIAEMFRFIILTAYMSSPCHIEVILTEKEDVVAKATEEEPSKKKLSKKKLARQKEKMMRE